MPGPAIRIDREHTLRLLAGNPVTIKVPNGAKTVTLLLDAPKYEFLKHDSVAHILDVFLNGRKA